MNDFVNYIKWLNIFCSFNMNFVDQNGSGLAIFLICSSIKWALHVLSHINEEWSNLLPFLVWTISVLGDLPIMCQGSDSLLFSWWCLSIIYINLEKLWLLRMWKVPNIVEVVICQIVLGDCWSVTCEACICSSCVGLVCYVYCIFVTMFLGHPMMLPSIDEDLLDILCSLTCL